MDLFAIFFNSFIVGFSGAMMPGPLLAVGIAETPRHGWRTGPIISTGHAVAEVFVVAVLLMGVITFAEDSVVTKWIGVIGGAALLLMGSAMALDVVRNRINYGDDLMRGKSSRRLAGEGITATLSNPYWFVWWATIGLALLVDSKRFGIVGPVTFYFGHILSDFVWYTAVSFLLWRGKRLFMGRGLKALMLACAAFMLYLGILFIYNGLHGGLRI